jgi:hypothetical protein
VVCGRAALVGYSVRMVEHWDWAEVYTVGESEPRYVRGYCDCVDLVRAVAIDPSQVIELPRVETPQ